MVLHLFLTITFGGFALLLGVLAVMRALYRFGVCAEPRQGSLLPERTLGP
jgi:hypothetical protein